MGIVLNNYKCKHPSLDNLGSRYSCNDCGKSLRWDGARFHEIEPTTVTFYLEEDEWDEFTDLLIDTDDVPAPSLVELLTRPSRLEENGS